MIRDPEIRFANKADLDALVGLCLLHAIFEKNEYDTENKKQKLSEHLFSENPSLFCLVVAHNDTIIGYATYMKQFSTWDCAFYMYLDCLFLIQESRGFGTGVKLMDRIKQESVKLNCELIQWQTPDFNLRAIKFYDRIGGVSKRKERYFLKI